MAAGPLTQAADMVIPAQFARYIIQLTVEKSRLLRSGAMRRSPLLDAFLAGGGTTINIPSFRVLDTSDVDRVSTDTPAGQFTGGVADPDPFKIETDTEIATRLSRNASWSSADLAQAVAGEDIMGVIANDISDYWVSREQGTMISTVVGMIADNTANDSGDYTNDISGTEFLKGTTDFHVEAFNGARLTMGDSANDTGMMMVHSTVFNTMENNDLIDFIKDSTGEIIRRYRGYEVIVDDTMPVTGQVYDTWLFGQGALQLGIGSPRVPFAVVREEGAGSGGGQEIIYSRRETIIHPTGHAYTGAVTSGGPDDTVLDDAASWNRVYPNRKQIPFARLVTREAS